MVETQRGNSLSFYFSDSEASLAISAHVVARLSPAEKDNLLGPNLFITKIKLQFSREQQGGVPSNFGRKFETERTPSIHLQFTELVSFSNLFCIQPVCNNQMEWL